MKSKTSLLLMEQLVMILVFALAAALCLQAFAQAKTISRETERLDRAVTLAQNAAELLKATGGDAELAESLGQDGYCLRITETNPKMPGLAQAEIQVSFEGAPLFSLETGWQEVLP